MSPVPWERLAIACKRPASSDGAVIVVEEADDGAAVVTFWAQPGWRLESLALNHKYVFNWLLNRKAADGVVLAQEPGGLWQAHIVECKRTVSEKGWRHIQKQFHGSRVRLDALMGVLSLEVSVVHLHTAYVYDRIGLASPDPVLFGLLEGKEAERVRSRITWGHATIELPDFGSFQHNRLLLQLDETDGVGKAEFQLTDIGQATSEAEHNSSPV